MRTILMAAMLATASTGFAADAGNEDLIALIEAQQKQIELLQQQLDATRSTLTQLSEQVQANTQASVEANEKAEILADTMEETPVMAENATKLGGYGELHVNMLEDQLTGNENNVLDFHRFVMFFSHDFNDRLRFNSELEVEHAYSGDDKPGAVELEQAYIEYDWRPGHSLKAGLFLIPVGILNETHEPPTFYGVERNPVEKNIIPTTWWEGGAGPVSYTHLTLPTMQ